MKMVKRSRFIFAVLAAACIILWPGVSRSAPRTVTVWTYIPGSAEAWKARQADIEKKFGISLRIEVVKETTFIEKLTTAVIDGRNYPDIIEWKIENNQIIAADPKRSFVAPLEKWTRRSPLFKAIVPGRVSLLQYGQHIYGLPKEAIPCVLVYNDTLWKSVGVDVAVLETWDDFFDAAQKLAAKKKNGKPLHYALSAQDGGLSDTMFMIMQQAVQVLDKQGKSAFGSPEFITFVKKWMAWRSTGTIGPWDWGKFGALLKDGTLASYIAPDWWISQVDEAAKAGRYQFRVRPLPYYIKGGPRTATWGGAFMAIVKQAKNQDQLYKIMEELLFGDKASLARLYREDGLLTSLTSVWDDPVFHQPDPRFGGQKLGELQISLAREMPAINSGDIYWAALQIFDQQYFYLVRGEKSVEGALKTAQNELMKFYGGKYTPKSTKTTTKVFFGEDEFLSIHDGMASFNGKQSSFRYYTNELFPMNFSASVKVKWDGGLTDGYGMVFWVVEEESSFYAFLIAQTGYYMITKYAGGKWDILVQWQPSSALKKTDYNRLEVICRDLTASFYINGTFVYSLENLTRPGRPTTIGIGANNGIQCSFKDFEVTTE